MNFKHIVMAISCATLISGPSLKGFESIKNFVKHPVTICSAAAIAGLGGFYFYKKRKAHNKRAQDVAVFFDHAKEKNSELRKSGIEIYLPHLELANIIANRDVESLKKMSSEELERDFRIAVPGDKFQNNFNGRLLERYMVGENAISVVIFHSILDKTVEDEKKTLEMLQVLFDKKINPCKRSGSFKGAGFAYLIKVPNSSSAWHDYILDMSLLELAEYSSFGSVRQLLKQYINSFEESQLNQNKAKICA